MRSWGLVLAYICAVGCADDDHGADPYKCIAAGGARCFQFPTEPLAAVDVDGATVNPVLDCAPYEVVSSAGPVTLSGTAQDPVSLEPIADVRVEVFSDAAMTAQLADVRSDTTGKVSVIVDPLPSLGFTRTSGDGMLPFHLLYQRFDVSQSYVGNLAFESAPRTVFEDMLAAAGDQFYVGKSQVVMPIRDCAGNKLVNAIANIAPSSGANGSRLFVDGVRIFYLLDGALARRTVLLQTSEQGGAAATNLSPGRYFAQVWGFPTEADLRLGSTGLVLLAEHEILVPSVESGIVMPLHARL